ncbi:ThiF family protein [Nitrosomonas aestuarii]|uniref:ThiF family protein n=1 Tax=Nitrosomonas aestuarii TaxID=52441 RepID=A0A1I3Z4A1_9PROT|nr:ThiF family adenylyltransferase [Nitrosomonas aestuarii]SFK38379.1 ThiF family protein [Nitrosomonas aestuarii]
MKTHEPLSKESSAASWSYDKAFSRNLGLISPQEQEKLRTSRAAILGLGGVGGVNLVTLARLGISKFTIADPDNFEIGNINRQYGAMCSTAGHSKAQVMQNIILDINPEAEIKVITDPVGPDNADDFLEGADVLVDGIDAFEIDIRRLLYRKAYEKGIYALGAGPVGFSTVWVIFGPEHMPFDRYFDLSDHLNSTEKFAAYIVGMAPAGLHRSYIDLSYINIKQRTGPSAGLACHLASGVIAAEVLKILLRRGRIYGAPYYHQFDAYRGRLVRRRLIWGNRSPLQYIKRRWLVNFIKQKTQSA